MSKLKGLLLTEGMHGMISQVEGLAKALDIEFTHQKVELNSFWKMIPPNLTPISNFVFKKFDTPDFDVIISCGRKSVIPSIYLKKNSNKKIFNIHIQDPKVSLSNFDFVIAPEHDTLNGKNVIVSKGAIHYLTLDEIKNNHSYLEEKLKKDKDYLLLVLGGPNKYYDYEDQNLINIFDQIIAPEHDSLKGKNVITSKGAIHYLTLDEIKNNHSYLEAKLKKKYRLSIISFRRS